MHENSSSSSANRASDTRVPSLRTIRILERIGWCIFAVWLIGIVSWAVVEPNPYADGWRLVLELAVAGGRAVNIADGVANDFSAAYLLFQCGLQDVALTLVVYPWIVRAYLGIKRFGVFGRVVESLRRGAERHSNIIEPLGGVGLWVFVFFPFWSTGVLNGAALGFILGMRTSVNLSIVISSHLVSLVALLFFFESISAAMESTSKGLVKYLPWIVLSVLLAGLGLQQSVALIRQRKK